MPVLAAGGVLLRNDVPAVFKTNYAAALLAADNMGGCLSVLVAVRRLVEQVSFPAVVAELVDEHRISVRAAFTIALRGLHYGRYGADEFVNKKLIRIGG